MTKTETARPPMNALEEYMNMYGAIIARHPKPLKIGQILPGLQSTIDYSTMAHPFFVKRQATREEYELQCQRLGRQIEPGFEYSHPYFYELMTD